MKLQVELSGLRRRGNNSYFLETGFTGVTTTAVHVEISSTSCSRVFPFISVLAYSVIGRFRKRCLAQPHCLQLHASRGLLSKSLVLDVIARSSKVYSLMHMQSRIPGESFTGPWATGGMSPSTSSRRLRRKADCDRSVDDLARSCAPCGMIWCRL